MAKISLPDFFRYYAGTAEQMEAVVLLEASMPGHLLQDDSAWVVKFREQPEPTPAATGEQLVTLEQLATIWECAPSLIKPAEIDEMNTCLRRFEMNAIEIKHFLSQTAHESGGGCVEEGTGRWHRLRGPQRPRQHGSPVMAPATRAVTGGRIPADDRPLQLPAVQ